MVINEKTQLGLGTVRDFSALISAMRRLADAEKDTWGAVGGGSHDHIAKLRDEVAQETGIRSDLVHLSDGDLLRSKLCHEVFGDYKGVQLYLETNPGKCMVITSTVETCAGVIRMGEGFTTGILKKLWPGTTTLLMGRDEFAKVVRKGPAVIGYYWNQKTDIAFEFGFDLETEGYYFPQTQKEAFNRIAKILTFILLGDIETLFLDPGKSNNKPKNSGKIINTSRVPVTIVDSRWNTIVVRTDGFGVRGHFRLQPCGAGRADRKLVWIAAFEKHGYTRRAGVLR